MKGFLSLGWFVGLSFRYKKFLFCLGSLVSTVQNIFCHRALCQFLGPHRPASWAGSRAVSPVSSYVSLAPATASPANMGRISIYYLSPTSTLPFSLVRTKSQIKGDKLNLIFLIFYAEPPLSPLDPFIQRGMQPLAGDRDQGKV